MGTNTRPGGHRRRNLRRNLRNSRTRDRGEWRGLQ